MKAASHSTSELLMTLVDGPVVKGTYFGRHELRFGDYIVAFTAPGFPRMPNGIECRVTIQHRARAAIGMGLLVVGRVAITPGRSWDPVPVFEPIPCLPPGLPPTPSDSAQANVLGGYLAGLVLLHQQRAKAETIAARAVLNASPADATLLRHAARGEVPEPVHDLLSTRDASQLISSSRAGIAWLRGLISAGLPLDLARGRIVADRRTA